LKIRSAFYVDGFNLYHAIADLDEPFLKWLNLWKLAETLVPSQTEDVVRVVFCTAYYPGNEQKRWRHGEYKKALECVGVKCEFGHYVHESAFCKKCNHEWEKPSEKQSDINVALNLYHDACTNIFDKAYLVTADSDQAATARFLAGNFPAKQLVSVAPPGRNFSANIVKFAQERMQISKDALERSLFPPIVTGQGVPAARRPREWDPPAWWVQPDARPKS
jgi:hypothetical protein